MMIEEVLAYLNNYFVAKEIVGDFVIEGGTLYLEDLQDGQYYRIIGSVSNDGVHEYPSFDLTDEEFSGRVFCLSLPARLLDTVEDIEEWIEKTKDVSDSPYASESFGGYSYSLKDDAQTSSWKTHFKERLSGWMKL